jgi:RNA polymerase sigma factor (sigma-70 family)
VEDRHRPPPAPEPAGPDERAAQLADDAAVMAALRRLPARQQEILVLRYYLDASEGEIADLVGISRGSVKTHAHRGLAALRAALADRVGGAS